MSVYTNHLPRFPVRIIIISHARPRLPGDNCLYARCISDYVAVYMDIPAREGRMYARTVLVHSR